MVDLSREALVELAERVEKAEGAEQATLLREAFVAIHGPKPERVHGGSPELDAWLGLFNPFYHMIEAKAFESAAMSLLPTDGSITLVDINLTWEQNEPAIWPAASVRWYPPQKAGPDWHALTISAASLPLTIVAAALRARSAALS